MEISKEEYLKSVAQELHKPVRKSFPKRVVRALYKDEVWSMDLVDMGELADTNAGYRYMLNAVDVFTRYAFSRPMKNKTARDTMDAFLDIIKTSQRQPSKIWVDKGKEFYNSLFERWMKENDCVMYSTYSDSKSVIVERFNRTLKTKMWFYFTEHNTRKWVAILKDLISDYNNTIHSKIKMTPVEASMDKNKAKIEKINAIIPIKKKKIPKFTLDDAVRISRQKGIFEKGYHPNFSRETFKVVEIKIPDSDEPITYKLKDYLGNEIEGSFYEPELVKVKYPDIFLVEKTLKTKTVKGKKEYFVKWLGIDSKQNSWVKAEDFTMGKL